jgi:sulfoxide reductase heme-binding subunit YedZ
VQRGKGGAQRWLKPLLHLLALLPLLWLIYLGLKGGLGANPIEKITRELGDWALIVLLCALSVTPLRQISGWSALARVRRLVGLWAFAYALLHVAAYVGLDQFFDWRAIGADIIKRFYITLGMAGFVILTILAVTSLPRLVRALGGRRWVMLHRTVYGAVLLGVLHYAYMVKADLRTPVLYGGVALFLLLVRRLPLQRWGKAWAIHRPKG